MSTRTFESIGVVPAQKLLHPMLWVSCALSIVMIGLHISPLDIHAWIAIGILILNTISIILDRGGKSIMALHIFYINHTLAFVLPGFLGVGRIVDLIVIPSMMCWALMTFSNRRIVLLYMAALTFLGCAALYQLRTLQEAGTLKIFFLEDVLLGSGVLAALYMTARTFFSHIKTYRKLREQKELDLRGKSKELQQHIDSNLQLESFAHKASDALARPLDDVLAQASMFKQKTAERLSDQEGEYLAFIIQQASQMNELTTGLLALSKLSTDETDKRSINTHGLIDRLLDGQFADRRSAIAIGHLPAQISANPMQLHTLLKNLIENAFKYAHPHRDPRVVISASSDAMFHTFYVKDNGQGISDEQKENAFLIFKRLQHDGKGTGIGLATCKRIVEKHGGTIYIQDNPAGGSIFVFTLPV